MMLADTMNAFETQPPHSILPARLQRCFK